MVNRVLLNSDRLNVSMPGFDVLTTGNDNLNFSSDWSGLTSLMQGEWIVQSGASSVLYFGKTFITIPLVSIALTGLERAAYQIIKVTPINAQYSNFRLYADRMTYYNQYSVAHVLDYRIWDYNE